jgi:hypothetical protein
MSNARGRSRIDLLLPLLVFCGVFSLYAATAAPATLFGDPSEYQFVPAILGISHPPGYCFYTLLAKAWQLLVPVGTIAYRTNRLACAAGGWTATMVYLSVVESARAGGSGPRGLGWARVGGLFGALALPSAADFWQHSIHSNAHIVSAALVATHLWLLLHWWRTGRDRWLGRFALTLGLAAVHHPITLMGIPGYAAFILVVRPRLLRNWRLLGSLVACLLVGLTPFLYLPLRGPEAPFNALVGWESVWTHFTARGLRVNLFHFGLADQPDRAAVFWSVLRIQFPLATIGLMAWGAAWVCVERRRAAVLLGTVLAGHLVFTLNTVQDVMAYLLMPFAALAVLGGLGVVVAGQWFAARASGAPGNARRPWVPVLALLLLILPVAKAAGNVARGISLADFDEAEEYVAAVYELFAGRGRGAVLLSDWEHLTPLWVHMYTQGELLEESDVELVYVNPSSLWVDLAQQYVGERPVYAVGDPAALRQTGFRLIPDPPLYLVQTAPAEGAPPDHALDIWVDDRIQILGFDLGSTTVRAGESLVLVLYARVLEPLDGIWMPYGRLGDVEVAWTTDSRLLTCDWLPGEVVAQEYMLPVPFYMEAADHALLLGYADLTGGRPELPLSGGEKAVELATVTVLPNPAAPPADSLQRAVANLENEIGLIAAWGRAGLAGRGAPWEDPLVVNAGSDLHLTLKWTAWVAPADSRTVFVHLMDSAGRPVAGHDYTPLGGSAPTYLWFPKWLPGQVYVDPYRLHIPAEVEPGDYLLEVGMYGMTSLRRLHVVDSSGDVSGDRVILGPVTVK